MRLSHQIGVISAPLGTDNEEIKALVTIHVRYPQAKQTKPRMINLLQENKEYGKPPHKLHIWFFADTQANVKKLKEQFYFRRSTKNKYLAELRIKGK